MKQFRVDDAKTSWLSRNKTHSQGGCIHYNKPDKLTQANGFENEWNQMEVFFLPAKYSDSGEEKCSNAYLRTRVNGNVVFRGELKSGTRNANRRLAQQGGRDPHGQPTIIFEKEVDPERDVYVGNAGDMAIRILGHWGTPVSFRNPLVLSSD